MLIRLTHYSSPEPHNWMASKALYGIYLGNGKRFTYTNEKACKKFLTETNVFLNDRILQINDCLAKCTFEMRQNWPYFHTGRSQAGELSQIYKECAHDIDRVAWSLDRLLVVLGSNYNHFVWRHMQCACNDLIKIGSNLARLQEIRHNPNSAAAMRALIRTVQYIDQDLNNWPDIEN